MDWQQPTAAATRITSLNRKTSIFPHHSPRFLSSRSSAHTMPRKWIKIRVTPNLSPLLRHTFPPSFPRTARGMRWIFPFIACLKLNGAATSLSGRSPPPLSKDDDDGRGHKTICGIAFPPRWEGRRGDGVAPPREKPEHHRRRRRRVKKSDRRPFSWLLISKLTEINHEYCLFGLGGKTVWVCGCVCERVSERKRENAPPGRLWGGQQHVASIHTFAHIPRGGMWESIMKEDGTPRRTYHHQHDRQHAHMCSAPTLALIMETSTDDSD